MTETMTDEQRTEVRRSLLQSVAEMSRGLKVISGFLKMGKFGMARDQIAAVDAMLQLHEMLAQRLLKDTRRAQADLDAVVTELDRRAAAFRTTADGLWEAVERRDPDRDYDAAQRYEAYATGALATAQSIKKFLADRK